MTGLACVLLNLALVTQSIVVFVLSLLVRRMLRRIEYLERADRARRSPSSIDPTSSPQLALVEAPSSATDNPAVAEPRELAVTPPLPSMMHVALDPRQTQAIAPGAEW